MTKPLHEAFTGNSYFNSHPHEEDDLCGGQTLRSYSYFNSHPHEEDDLGNSSSVTASPISTHILTKRMTVLHCVIGDIKNHFNSHPHEEDDIPVTAVSETGFIFQLTSSRRG